MHFITKGLCDLDVVALMVIGKHASTATARGPFCRRLSSSWPDGGSGRMSGGAALWLSNEKALLTVFKSLNYFGNIS